MSYTKEKWEIDSIRHDDVQCIIKSGNQFICNTLSGNDEANAKRICQTNNNFDALLDACKKVQRWLDTSSLQGVLVHRTNAKEKDALIMGVASHLIRLEQAIADAEKGQGNE